MPVSIAVVLNTSLLLRCLTLSHRSLRAAVLSL